MSTRSTSNKKESSRKVRYAVVGLGHIAQVAVLPAFRSAGNSELRSVVSSDEEKRAKVTRQYRLKESYSYDQYEQALKNVDAVYIALPNHLHREYTVRAAKAGKHVLCEKPMAVTEDECEVMIEAARSHAVKLMIAYRLHFERGNLEAVKLAHNGTIGEVRFFSSEFAQQVAEDNVRVTEPVEKGGGPVYDMGVYCINAARYLFQAEPIQVLAASATARDDARFDKTNEMTSAILRFPDERLAMFTCSFGAADVSRYTAAGTKGILAADPAYEYSTGVRHQLTKNGKTKKQSFPKRDQFAAEIVYFSDCILKNKEPEPSGLEGLADVKIVRAIYESARRGSAVELSGMPQKKKPASRQEIHRPAHGKPETHKVKSASGE
jgi:predicted dehydrogenase